MENIKLTPSKELYEIIDYFEKIAKSLVRFGTMGFTKTPKENWRIDNIYEDGELSKSFKMFYIGASFGKCYYRE